MNEIHRLFNPAGLAVIGSMTAGKLGYELVNQILSGGFQNVFAVNPKSQGALGISGFASVSEINNTVDLVVIVSPPDTVLPALKDCAQAGVKVAVIITSGFGEVGNIIAENQITDFSAQHGIRIIGPNCAGIVSTPINLYATLEVRPPRGKMSFISQSGALGGAVLSWAEEQGVGISRFVSYGNRADLDEIDLLPFLAEDPDTSVTALYIESIKDGSKFISAIKNYCRKKPLVVIKSGRTQSGQRAALSHTGSLAGSDQVYDSVLKDCGAIRVETVEEMFDLCKGFASLPPVLGRKIAVVTNSGGPGILAADRAEKEGLSVNPPGKELLDNLKSFLPPICGLQNPVDLTVQGTEEDYYQTITAALAEYDSAMTINVATPYLDSLALARGIVRAAEQSIKPVAANFMAGDIVKESIAFLQARNIPNYPIAERGISVLARMAEYEIHRQNIEKDITYPFPSTPASLQNVRDGKLLEPDAINWLADNNIPVPRHFYAGNIDEVNEGCAYIGFPLVMKIVSPQIIHKSDFGGVILDIQSAVDARKAFTHFCEKSRDLNFFGVMMYPMLRKSHEVILGFSRDPQFGPIVILGMGGIYTEILKDISIKTAPISLEKSLEMIRNLKGFPILSGSRGQKPSDLNSLAELISNFSKIPLVYPQINEIDLNPVFVSEKGAVVADVRVILKER